VDPYDHQTKAGNEGDVVKHPALIAALNGLLAEQQGLFRYADAFAGRWAYALREGGAWTNGIEQFAARWSGGNRDVALWRQQWTAAKGLHYPGSTQLAQRILSGRGAYEIRAFEVVEAYAAGLRQKLGNAGVFARSASPKDWTGWRPNLLFIDPPGLRCSRKPDDPALGSLLRLAQGIEDVLMWLPMARQSDSNGSAGPPAPSTGTILDACARQGFQVLAVRWCEEGPMTGCLLAHRFDSATAVRRVTAAVENVVRTMGPDWRVV
jgi:hypothetical protein